MNLIQTGIPRRLLLLIVLSLGLSTAARADKWIDPTPEELKMTSQPQVPGAPAVYLYREEMTDDKMHSFSIYIRLKVLTDKGKDYGNVELNYSHNSEGGGYTVNDITGRTIHSDGKVIPFTGKPYDKLIEKDQTHKYMAKVFSMPDIEVGSIIEYRYTLRYDDHYFISPQWYIQSALYTRKGHYMWRPTNQQLISSGDRGALTNSIAWTPILPAGTEVKQTRSPGNDGQLTIQVDVHDIPPAPDEELMPPISSITYRVLFYYSPYNSNADFWKGEGKYWSKMQDKFIGPGPGVVAAVHELTAPADTQDQKLRKLYAAVMKMENTDFTHDHSDAEEKSQGLKQVHTTEDILARKRGSSDQLTDLFVAMARAAGMKAYVMTVTNRDRHIFLPSYFNLSQFDDNIAIVNVNGKEISLDPGSRYCPYGHLAWKHTQSGGMRQIEAGASLDSSAPESYLSSKVLRVANLTMDDHGAVTGTVKMTYTGAPALAWRQLALAEDATALEHSLRQKMERTMPAGLDILDVKVEKVVEYEEPLVATFKVSGSFGSSTGKRLLIPGNFFEARSKPVFSHENREASIDFDYPSMTQDAVRINFPRSMTLESIPTSETFQYLKDAAYSLRTESTPTSVTLRREFALANYLFDPKEYGALRTFYGRFGTKDQEAFVLKLADTNKQALGGTN